MRELYFELKMTYYEKQTVQRIRLEMAERKKKLKKFLEIPQENKLFELEEEGPFVTRGDLE